MTEDNTPESTTTPPAEADGSVSVELKNPIRAYNDTLSAIKFRKPTGGDMMRIGNPVDFDPISDPPKISHNNHMVPMLARLANIPTSSFENMDTQDLVACYWAVTPFFMPTPGRV